MGLLFVHPPRITAATFARVLHAAHSPAAPDAAALFAIPVAYGLDPALALAFFGHESRFGTQGIAVKTRNWGNLRRSQGRALRVQGGWAWYATWADSLADWCTLIQHRYVGRGLDTPAKALPVYAPSSDGNAPARYAAAVAAMVARWQAEETAAEASS